MRNRARRLRFQRSSAGNQCGSLMHPRCDKMINARTRDQFIRSDESKGKVLRSPVRFHQIFLRFFFFTMHVSFFYSRLQLLTVRLFWHNLQFRHDSFDTTFWTIFLTFFPDSGVNLPTFTRAEEHHNKMAATSSAPVLLIHKQQTNLWMRLPERFCSITKTVILDWIYIWVDENWE